MNEPTQEQIKEFWEWCGWREDIDKGRFPYVSRVKWYPPEGHALADSKYVFRTAPPEIDLNNLFKYAVPKLMEYHESQSIIGYLQTSNWLMESWVGDWIDSNNSYDPALALFWAIWEVFHNERTG